jgi:hypothetical protein
VTSAGYTVIGEVQDLGARPRFYFDPCVCVAQQPDDRRCILVVRNCISPIIVGWTDEEKIVLFGCEQEEGYTGTVIGEVHKDPRALTPIVWPPLRLRWCTTA